MAVGSVLLGQIRGGPCRVFSSDLRLRVPATGLATYPEVTVICSEIEADPHSKVTATNPTVIVEVLSARTEDYDRGEKFEHYRQIPGLREYVLVSHDNRQIEVRHRGEDGEWTTRISTDADIAELASIGATLDVREIYATAGAP